MRGFILVIGGLASFSQVASGQVLTNLTRSTLATDSFQPGISESGRYVVLQTSHGEFDPTDTNGHSDVYLLDRTSGTFERVSKTNTGGPGNGPSQTDGRTNVTDSGQYVVFWSLATTLVASDTNGVADIFLRDRIAGTTVRVSVSNTGAQGNGASAASDMSADGRYVVFASLATNLWPGDTNLKSDIFRFDRMTGVSTLVSGAPGGMGNGHADTPTVSNDGRYVAFASSASNLVPGDGNFAQDIFVRDMTLATTQRVSLTSAGLEGSGNCFWPSISSNGMRVAFQCSAPLAAQAHVTDQVYCRDRTLSTTTLVSVSPSGIVANDACERAVFSADGIRVAFSSLATNIAGGGATPTWNVYLRDRDADWTMRLSNGLGGGGADAHCTTPAISGNGDLIAFESAAANLTPGDPSFIDDFLADMPDCVSDATPYCTAKTNSLGCVPSIGSAGAASATSSDPFLISACNVINNKIGILLYKNSVGGSGQGAIPFTGGTLCFSASPNRTTSIVSGGTPAPVNDCSGVFAIDMNAFAQGLIGGPPFPQPYLLTVGQEVCAQFWGRDPGFAAPGNTQLSDGLRFTICP